MSYCYGDCTYGMLCLIAMVTVPMACYVLLLLLDVPMACYVLLLW